MSRRTPWFDGCERPARLGVYQRRYGHNYWRFCLWDGALWFVSSAEPTAAAKAYTDSAAQSLPWRGLARPA